MPDQPGPPPEPAGGPPGPAGAPGPPPASPPRRAAVPPPKRGASLPSADRDRDILLPKTEEKNGVTSPPPAVSTFKVSRQEAKAEPKTKPAKKELVAEKEVRAKSEKLSIAPVAAVEPDLITDIDKPQKTDKANGNGEATANATAVVSDVPIVKEKNSANATVTEAGKNEESNGVGDKIKRFEKAAEDASLNSGKLSRPGSVRGRGRTERLGSDENPPRKPLEKGGSDEQPPANSNKANVDQPPQGRPIKLNSEEQAQLNSEKVISKNQLPKANSDKPGPEELPPPATPFKDNMQFDLPPPPPAESLIQNSDIATTFDRQQSISKTNSSNIGVKWQKNLESQEAEKVKKPEPQKIIKPEFKPIASPVDVTIRSPSLGAKIADQFPSHGTAFRNVASPDVARPRDPSKLIDDVNTQNNHKACKVKSEKKYSVSKGSSYFTRGSEEIWLVKKKDIEEIEERVLDSFRRAGGNICMRSESMRPSSDSGQSVSFSHATMGRNKRQMYARSESLDPQLAGARSQTLKRQTSVACTCGHDKKARARSAGAEEPRPRSHAGADNTRAHVGADDTRPHARSHSGADDTRPRSRSHADDSQAHVLDKYETLV